MGAYTTSSGENVRSCEDFLGNRCACLPLQKVMVAGGANCYGGPWYYPCQKWRLVDLVQVRFLPASKTLAYK